jgi:hypothetical protein
VFAPIDQLAPRHCEERSGEAIQPRAKRATKKHFLGVPAGARWIASLRSQ